MARATDHTKLSILTPSEAARSDGEFGVQETSSQDSFLDLVSAFRQETELLAQYARLEGIELIPYRSPSLDLFRALPEAKRLSVYKSLRSYREIMSTLKENDENLSFNLNGVWLALSTFGMRWHEDLFKILQPEDVIEIHTMDGIQIFRSFHVFKFISYDLETLTCVPWYELYERSDDVNEALLKCFDDIQNGRIKGVQPVQVKPHMVIEKLKGRPSNITTPKYVSILRDSNQNQVGYIHAFRAQAVHS